MSSTYTVEVESAAPAAKLFKAVSDWHNLGVELLPDIIGDVVLLSGDHGPGTVRQINFVSGMPYSYMKECVDILDHENFVKKATVVEGGGLGDKFESVAMYFKLDSKDETSTVKFVMNYTPLPGVDISDDLKMAGKGVEAMVKTIEGYLLAHPNY